MDPRSPKYDVWGDGKPPMGHPEGKPIPKPPRALHPLEDPFLERQLDAVRLLPDDLRRSWLEAAIEDYPWRVTFAIFVIACAFVAVVMLLGGCATSWTPDDTTANTVGARSEARVLELCSGDAGGCTPSKVRSFTMLSYCANARELSAHGAPFDGGPPCR